MVDTSIEIEGTGKGDEDSKVFSSSKSSQLNGEAILVGGSLSEGSMLLGDGE